MSETDLQRITTYQAGAKQASVHRTLQKLCDEILAPYDITKMQWLIIGHVLDASPNGIRVSDLADALSTTIPYVTNASNVLVAQGWLIRKQNDSDSRSRLLVIDPALIAKCKEIEAALREGLRRSIYAEIDPREFKIYMKVLYQLDKATSPVSAVK